MIPIKPRARNRQGQLRRELEKQRDIIGKARDRMRELLDEYDDIWRSAAQAADDLDRVIDRVSELC